MSMSLEQPDWMPLLTAASLEGWGARCLGVFAQGLWSLTEASWSIVRLGFRARFLGLQACEAAVSGSALRVLSDSSAKVAYFNRQDGAGSAAMEEEADQLFA